MERPRYGKFRVRDYGFLLAGAAFVLALGIGGLASGVFADEDTWLAVWPIVFGVGLIWSVVAVNMERFTLSDNIITVRRGRHTRDIRIPDDALLVISHADAWLPLGRRIGSAKDSVILKGRIGVTILQHMPLETALERLYIPKSEWYLRYLRHPAIVYRTGAAPFYCMSSVEQLFDEGAYRQYLYSFECDDALLQELMTGRHCQVIVPENLLPHVPAEQDVARVHIDRRP
ncbi:MAG: hypothetical protein IJY28_10485 [Clostridia bacterium]|nr:hypothetical protein [Clostridia bacterium]